MLPTDAKTRKGIPVYEGFFKYFPDAIAAVAQCSAISNAQHSGEGAPVQWVKETSTDELDALLRHMLDGTVDERDMEGVMHAVKIGWRAFANLQRMADAGINIYAVPPDSNVELLPVAVPGMITATEILDRRKMYEPEWQEPNPEA